MSETLNLSPMAADALTIPAKPRFASSEMRLMANSYRDISEGITTYYLNAPMVISDDRRAFAKEVQLHIESLCAILLRVNGAVDNHTFTGLNEPISAVSTLLVEWKADGMAPSRDIVYIAELVMNATLVAVATFSAEGIKHRGWRKRIVSMIA